MAPSKTEISPFGADASMIPAVVVADHTPVETAEKVLPPGTTLHGRYEIERVLGSGGMATVYLGRHIEIGAPLAVKVLHPRLATLPTATEHFLNEARGVSRIQHPHVVAVSDYGKLPDGVPFMVMEYLNGEDLDSLVAREGPLPWPRVRNIGRQICEALGAGHLQGVIHRDVKPQNCFRQPHPQFGDFIKVLDFGIAQVGEDAQQSGSAWAQRPILGTPEYIAPEVSSGGEVDHRADIYSLGVTLFTLLTGRLPFEATDVYEQIAQHQHVEPPAPSAVAPPGVVIPPVVDAVILRALAKRPSDRYATMAAFGEAIERAGVLESSAATSSTMSALRAWGRARSRRSTVALASAGATAVVVAVLLLTFAPRTEAPAMPEEPAGAPVIEPSSAAAALPVSGPPPDPAPAAKAEFAAEDPAAGLGEGAPPSDAEPPIPSTIVADEPPPEPPLARKRRRPPGARKPKPAAQADDSAQPAVGAGSGKRRDYGPLRNPYE